MKVFIITKIFVLLFSIIAFGRNGNNDPNLSKKSTAYTAQEQLDSLLGEIDNGGVIDMNRINALLGSVHNSNVPGPVALVSIYWNDFIKRVILKHPETIRKLIPQGIYDKNAFIMSLGGIGGDENTEFLIKNLENTLERIAEIKKQGIEKDKEWDSDQKAVFALGLTKSKKIWPVLHKAIEIDYSYVTFPAIDELAKAGDENIIHIIREWLNLKGEKLTLALKATVSLSNEQLKPKLKENLYEPLTKVLLEAKKQKADSNLYRYAIQAFASIGDESILPTLHEIVQDESEYLEEVEQLKRSPDPWRGRHEPWNYSQNEALDALGKLASPKSLEVLAKLAKDAKDENIRKKAQKIANEIRKKEGKQ